jgi:DNA-binding NtrC family response regulator
VDQQTVLVIDDEDSVRNVLIRMLKASGYAATGAATATAALGLFAEGNRFDLVICDQRMPGMNGNECLDHIREVVPDQRVLRVAGAAHDAEDEPVGAAPDTPVLIKPFTMERLLDSVRAVIPPAA